MENITWVQRRGQIKHLLYELCSSGRIDRITFYKQISDLNKVAPVNHGRWLIDKSGSLMCSKCGTLLDEEQKPSRYCPNCGAKMDEVKG